jgi:hypothetical protein
LSSPISSLSWPDTFLLPSACFTSSMLLIFRTACHCSVMAVSCIQLAPYMELPDPPHDSTELLQPRSGTWCSNSGGGRETMSGIDWRPGWLGMSIQHMRSPVWDPAPHLRCTSCLIGILVSGKPRVDMASGRGALTLQITIPSSKKHSGSVWLALRQTVFLMASQVFAMSWWYFPCCHVSWRT